MVSAGLPGCWWDGASGHRGVGGKLVECCGGVRGGRCFPGRAVDSAGFEQPTSEPGRGEESTRGPELTSISLRYFTHKENTTGRENANNSSACG